MYALLIRTNLVFFTVFLIVAIPVVSTICVIFTVSVLASQYRVIGGDITLSLTLNSPSNHLFVRVVLFNPAHILVALLRVFHQFFSERLLDMIFFKYTNSISFSFTVSLIYRVTSE